jgi:GcrA cell cycle regulator
MIRVTTWTPEIDDRMRELHALKLSFTEISARLNADFGLSTTRNACIGRGRRLKLPLRAWPPPRLTPKAPKARKSRKGKKRWIPPVTPAIVPEAPALVPGRLTMLQLGRQTCRWPSGTRPPYTYCGDPIYDDRPYCREHCRLSYQKPEKTWS